MGLVSQMNADDTGNEFQCNYMDPKTSLLVSVNNIKICTNLQKLPKG